jgi:transposase
VAGAGGGGRGLRGQAKPTPHERLHRRILQTFQKEGTIRGTARKVGCARVTVRRALRRGRPKRTITAPGSRPSKLDPYRAVIQRLVTEDHLTAVLVLEELRKLGYAGGHSILQDYVRQIRPKPKVRVTTVLEHPPGAEGQVDWSPYRVWLGGQERVVHAFSLVLPYSRFMVLRMAPDERLETLLRLHDEAFDELGGIVGLMTYDNMTTVGRHVGPAEIKLSERFEAYRKRCGFEVRLIDPGRPNQHASVERPFHYFENNCLRRRRSRFADWDDLKAHVRWWCDEVANVRVHGTTRERPVDRLLRERPYFLPLPAEREEPYQTLSRKVGEDFCVAVDTNRYSVPPRHAGQPATVRAYAERLELLVGGQVVAAHARRHGRRGRYVLPEHEEQFKKHSHSRVLLEQAFVRMGPVAKDYYEGLRAQRGRGAGYHLQRILKLADRHGSEAITGAMAHAARYGNYGAEAVARVVMGRALRQQQHGAPGAPVPEPPERVRVWLEGLHVEDSDLEDYDQIIAGQDRATGGTDHGEEE